MTHSTLSRIYPIAFFLTLAVFAIWLYRDFKQDAATAAKVERLAGQISRFNSENWKKVVPGVKEASLELRLHLGIELPTDAGDRLKAEEEARQKAEKEKERKEAEAARQDEAEMRAETVAAIQMALTKGDFPKGNPLEVGSEYAIFIERELHNLRPNLSDQECARLSLLARAYLAGQWVKDDAEDEKNSK